TTLSLISLLVGCDELWGDDIGYSPYCQDTETLIEDADAVTAIGVSGADLLSMLQESAEGVVRWEEGGDRGVAGTLDWGINPDNATLRFVDSEAVYPEPEPGQAIPAIDVECPDYIAVNGEMFLETEDGILDERLALTFTLNEYDTTWVNFSLALDPAGFSGSFDLEDYVDVEKYDEVSLSLNGMANASGLDARLEAQGTADDGEIAYAELLPVAHLYTPDSVGE
ncbi:MAG: hypothetical protein AAFV53_07775, partial [Myxococcota bacterium]